MKGFFFNNISWLAKQLLTLILLQVGYLQLSYYKYYNIKSYRYIDRDISSDFQFVSLPL